MKIVKYDIIVRWNRDELIKRINEVITDGWEPIGGAVVKEVYEDSESKPWVVRHTEYIQTIGKYL
jgi:hypothetical protein